MIFKKKIVLIKFILFFNKIVHYTVAKMQQLQIELLPLNLEGGPFQFLKHPKWNIYFLSTFLEYVSIDQHMDQHIEQNMDQPIDQNMGQTIDTHLLDTSKLIKNLKPSTLIRYFVQNTIKKYKKDFSYKVPFNIRYYLKFPISGNELYKIRRLVKFLYKYTKIKSFSNFTYIERTVYDYKNYTKEVHILANAVGFILVKIAKLM